MGASVDAPGVGTVFAMTRDPWLDNIKMTLVTLVVVGHSWGLLGATTLDLHLYDFLYYWHIPAFVLITGHLSRSFDWDRRHPTPGPARRSSTTTPPTPTSASPPTTRCGSA